MRLNHNMFSMGIYNKYKDSISQGKSSMEKISTGISINSAKDNPNKVASNELLKIQILSNSAAKQNVQDTNSMLQTFDGSMQEIYNNLSRMKELTVNASTASLEPEDRAVIQKEVDSIIRDIDYIANNTNFNGVTLLNDDKSTVTSLIGGIAGQNLEIPKFDLRTDKLFSYSAGGMDVVHNPSAANEAVDRALIKITKATAIYGALETRLQETGDNIEKSNETLQSAQSKIGDADIAKEMLKYSQSQILVKSSTALMAQSNRMPQEALQILSNIR